MASIHNDNSTSMELNNLTTNGTIANPNWTFTAVSQIIFSVLSVILNTGMLAYFIQDKKLHTSFSVYLMFLLSTNILYSLTQYPLSVYRELRSPAPMGYNLCSLFLYSGTALCSMSMHTHVLITINRIWALTFPYSYKDYHTNKIALLLCLISVAYVHVTVLPGLVLDVIYYWIPEEENGGCNFNAKKLYGWLMFVQFVVFDLPVVVVSAAFPFLWHKEDTRRKIKAARSPTSATKRTAVSVEKTGGSNEEKTEADLSAPSRLPASKSGSKISRAFLILTLLTGSIFICWTPNLAFWTVANLADLYVAEADYATATLAALQTVLDPILFAFSLKSFRKSVKKSFSKLKQA